MLNPVFRVDLRPFTRSIDDMRARQVPYAASRAINATLRDAKAEVAREMQKSFDKPTPWVARGIGLELSTKRDLRGLITLGTLGRSSVTSHHVVPGTRPAKGMEVALRQKGLLPSNMFVVPTSAAPRDAYGNVPRALVGQIMAALQAGAAATSQRGVRARKAMGKSGVEYFVGRPGSGLPAGIWEKRQFASGSGIRPIYLFVSSVRYNERLKFHEIVNRVAQAKFADNFITEFEQANRTAR